MYNPGHLYEAAVVHYLATGKKNFLDIAIKNADLIVKTNRITLAAQSFTVIKFKLN